MDLAQILYANRTYQDKRNSLRTRFIAPSKLKLFTVTKMDIYGWYLHV